jgi:hypothetical protein
MDEIEPSPNQVIQPVVITPETNQPPLPQVTTPPQPLSNRPGSKKKWLAVASVALLLLVALTSLYFLKIANKPASQTNNSSISGGGNSKINTSGSPSSIFAYMDQATTVQSADLTFTYGDELNPFVPALSGKVGHDSKNNLVASTPVDSKQVNQLLASVNKRRTKEGADPAKDPYNLAAKDSYGLDMLGLLNSTNSLPIDLFYLYGSDKVNSATCKDQLTALNDFAEQKLTRQTPNYQTSSSFLRLQPGEKAWTIDLYSLQDAILPKIKETEKICNIELPYPDAWQPKKGSHLAFKTVITPKGIAFEGYSDDGKLFKAQLTNLNKDKTVIAEPGPSLFDANRNNLYIAAVSACHGLPVVATDFAAANDYLTPQSSSYDGPNIFDSGYYCTAKDAESYGYQPSTL